MEQSQCQYSTLLCTWLGFSKFSVCSPSWSSSGGEFLIFLSSIFLFQPTAAHIWLKFLDFNNLWHRDRFPLTSADSRLRFEHHLATQFKDSKPLGSTESTSSNVTAFMFGVAVFSDASVNCSKSTQLNIQLLFDFLLSVGSYCSPSLPERSSSIAGVTHARTHTQSIYFLPALLSLWWIIYFIFIVLFFVIRHLLSLFDEQSILRKKISHIRRKNITKEIRVFETTKNYHKRFPLWLNASRCLSVQMFLVS